MDILSSINESKAETEYPQTPENDLIDFGQSDAKPATRAVPNHFPSDLKLAQTENNGQRQKELESMLRSTSTSPPPSNQDSLIDFSTDLKKTLPAVHQPVGLKREDTDSKSLDEFLDAEG